MIFEIPESAILSMLKRQILAYFPLEKEEEFALEKVFPLVLAKCEANFSRNPNRYFHSAEFNDEAYFNPFHSGQWTIFLYYMSFLLNSSGGGKEQVEG